MTSSEVKSWIERVGIVPVLRARSIAEATTIAEAIVEGGVTVLEVTMTVPDAIPLLREFKVRFGDSVLLGAGTVTTVEQCEASIEVGAEFVVSPGFSVGVVAKTRELGKVSVPGALTPTEVMKAWSSGADYIKVFPCSALGGASYLRSLRAPFPEVAFIPTGGITLVNGAEFLAAGARALGVGADLVSGEPEAIERAARGYAELVQGHRGR